MSFSGKEITQPKRFENTEMIKASTIRSLFLTHQPINAIREPEKKNPSKHHRKYLSGKH